MKSKLIPALFIAVFYTSILSAQTEANLILVEGGTFTMGRDYQSQEWVGKDEDLNDELPPHKVKVSDFYIAKFEVTVAQYLEFANANKYGIKMPMNPDDITYDHEIEDPKTGQMRTKTWYDEYPGVDKWQWSSNNPITGVTWRDAIVYCNWLSEKNRLPVAYKFKKVDLGDNIFEEQVVMVDANGNETTDVTLVKGYRLPTEAEWEYAARGGKKTSNFMFSGSNNPGEVAWTDETTYGKGPQMVGSLKPNELGIYDMSGNAWEWCYDFYQKDFYSTNKNNTNPIGPSRSLYKVIRGGGWYYMPKLSRSVVRDGPEVTYTNYTYGFRIARSK